jgi:2-oxoglutarate dehydrogenase complex dehydrogenase (E1) component-like enzyme
MESPVRCTLIGRCSESFAVKDTPRPRPGAAYLHHVADARWKACVVTATVATNRINDRRAAGGRRRPFSTFSPRRAELRQRGLETSHTELTARIGLAKRLDL